MARFHQLHLLIFLLSFMGVAGCASTSEERRYSNDEDTEFLHKYEKTFNPADYDPEIPSEQFDGKKDNLDLDQIDADQTTEPLLSEEVELVSGFRIQVSFTDNIEQAHQIKNELSSLVTKHAVYVVYEAPYYKVRVGDFLSRPEANLTLKSVIGKGYKDAWIVPDKILMKEGQ